MKISKLKIDPILESTGREFIFEKDGDKVRVQIARFMNPAHANKLAEIKESAEWIHGNDEKRKQLGLKAMFGTVILKIDDLEDDTVDGHTEPWEWNENNFLDLAKNMPELSNWATEKALNNGNFTMEARRQLVAKSARGQNGGHSMSS